MKCRKKPTDINIMAQTVHGFILKADDFGNPVRYKARLVVQVNNI